LGAAMMGTMFTVPVYIPSYSQSGDTHVVVVGDSVSWELSLAETYVPEHLATTLRFEAAPAGKSWVPYSGNPTLRWHPTVLRRGALTAWWTAEREVSGDIDLRALFRIGDSRLPEEGVPETEGRIRKLYWAFGLYRQRHDGPWETVPGVGLREAESTQFNAIENFTAYFPHAGVDVNDGRWEHVGWIALLDVADQPPKPWR